MSSPEPQQNRTRFDLSGCAALVTGAGGGIGAAVATAMAEQGAAVLVTDLDAASTTAEKIFADGGRAASIALDVRDSGAAAAAAAELAGDAMHIVVNNAGVTVPAMFGNTTEESVQLPWGTGG